MAKQKAKGLTGDLLAQPEMVAADVIAETPIAMTLKLPYPGV